MSTDKAFDLGREPTPSNKIWKDDINGDTSKSKTDNIP